MKISIGFITYNNSTYKYLKFFITSLEESIKEAKKYLTDLSFNFLIVDNSDHDYLSNYSYLIDHFKTQDNYKIFRSESNLGFAKAYNKMINWSIEKGDDLFLMLNPDVLLDINFIKKIILAFKDSPEASVLAPKILYWDFKNNIKTNIIDSYGLGLTRSHYFFDINQGREDFLQKKEEIREIFGFTGAGALLNLKRLVKVAYKGENYLEFFDELMFMYKEDVDLSYRLQILGEKIFFIPEAIMYHDRTLSKNKYLNLLSFRGRDISRSRSFLNQLIILYKIRKIPFSCKIRLFTFIRSAIILLYGLIFENKQIKKFKEIHLEIEKKHQYSSINPGEIKKIEGFMKGLTY
ncbi:MAG TPA: glycosyltransferase family 2 protein [bacterium]|nr:glycosyltransferase family 2 protein [bacterium]